MTITLQPDDKPRVNLEPRREGPYYGPAALRRLDATPALSRPARVAVAMKTGPWTLRAVAAVATVAAVYAVVRFVDWFVALPDGSDARGIALVGIAAVAIAACVWAWRRA